MVRRAGSALQRVAGFAARHHLVLYGLLLVGASLWLAAKIPARLESLHVSGQERVAHNLAEGHGFSLGRKHWGAHTATPRSQEESDGYVVTALKEPLYVGLIAAGFRFVGPATQPILLGFQILCLSLTGVVLYRLGSRLFDPWTGCAAGALLVLMPVAREGALEGLSEATVSGLLVAGAALALVRCLDEPRLRRALALGLLLGTSALVLASTLAFVPIAAFLVLLAADAPRMLRAKMACVLVLAAAAVVLPWTVRNYRAIGQFVPVRTGIGFNLYVGNPVLAATFTSGTHACADELGPMWKAEDATDALRLSSRSAPRRHALYVRARDCIEGRDPLGYMALDEHRRDRLFTAGFLAFAREEPATVISLTRARFVRFFYTGTSRFGRAVHLLAGVGAILALWSWRRLAVVLLALAPAAPHLLSLPTFDRYLYPVEPLLALLAGSVLVLAVSRGHRVLAGSRLYGALFARAT